VFYRGAGCPHCIEQLGALAPLNPEFQREGITLFGVSTDTVEGLLGSYNAVGAKTALPFQLVSDHALATFRDYGAIDARTRGALHGLFLIDGQGRIVWQSISAEPFMAVKSLLAEARRTLPLWAAEPVTLAYSPPASR
jgi:peroxiredoxin